MSVEGRTSGVTRKLGSGSTCPPTDRQLVGVNLDFPSERNPLIDMTLLDESYNFVPENWGVKL